MSLDVEENKQSCNGDQERKHIPGPTLRKAVDFCSKTSQI